jgi:hypothetical protein
MHSLDLAASCFRRGVNLRSSLEGGLYQLRYFRNRL